MKSWQEPEWRSDGRECTLKRFRLPIQRLVRHVLRLSADRWWCTLGAIVFAAHFGNETHARAAQFGAYCVTYGITDRVTRGVTPSLGPPVLERVDQAACPLIASETILLDARQEVRATRRAARERQRSDEQQPGDVKVQHRR